MNTIPDKIVDFHVHLFPKSLFDAIWKYFSRVYKWDILYHLYARDCIQYLFQKNVRPFVYSNYAHKKDVAQSLNNWNKQILNEHDNIYCFAAFHPDDENAIEIARNILSHPKVLGIKLQFLVTQFYPHDERLFPLYELIIEKKKRLLLHIGTGPARNIFVGADHFETVLKRYPELPANIAHMGGFEYKRFLDFLDRHENLYLDTAFSFLPHKKLKFNLDPALLIKYQNRIVYGSDFPNLIFPRQTEIDYLINLGLGENFNELIFYKNAIKIIKENGKK